MDDNEFGYLKSRILKLTDIDLDSYKSQQMQRRLGMFYSHSGAPNVAEFCRTLEHDREALARLKNFLTINVTEFFRDTSLFDRLRQTILSELQAASPRLNIWSAGCSRGAEPYTIALILESLFPFHAHRILATDIDEQALKQARAGGPYTAAEVRGVRPDFLRRYFRFDNGEYWVTDKIRQRVECHRQNLLTDRFERGFDLIFCRNVTIYFTDEAKTDLNRRFFQSLKEGGVLFIGGTEVMLDVTSLGFESLRASFYRKPVRGGAKTTPRQGALARV